MEPITQRELDLACGMIVLKTVRLFFDTPESEPHGAGAAKLKENWRRVPQERREAALLEFQRQLWQGLLDRLENSGPRPGERPYAHLLFRQGAKWR
jgi:hypothetical protein